LAGILQFDEDVLLRLVHPTYEVDASFRLYGSTIPNRRTGGRNQTGLSMTAVPCMAVEKYLE